MRKENEDDSFWSKGYFAETMNSSEMKKKSNGSRKMAVCAGFRTKI